MPIIVLIAFFIASFLNASLHPIKTLSGVVREPLPGSVEIAARRYETFNYPGALPGSKTLLTGIRRTPNENIVNISGFYECPDQACVKAFVYRGTLRGRGSWNVLNFPSGPGRTVKATNLYGPNNGPNHGIQVVGNYTTEETGSSTIGSLYQGKLDGSGQWTTLIPTVAAPDVVLNTIAHSTHGGLVVGNYDTQLDEGRAFIYDIKKKLYYEIVKPNAISITAYGIWHNRGNSYTIAGGYSSLDQVSGVDSAYLVDWDNKKHAFSNWRIYSYDNNPAKAIVTHFDGITSDRQGGYYLTGDWLGVGDGPELAFFAHVPKKGKAIWSSVQVPPHQITSGNSVYRKAVIGVYTSPEDPEHTVNGYISFSH
jgi:hypothetical protein